MGKKLSKGKQQSKDQEVATPTLKDAKVIFVIGGPGSGKGTQCAKLVEKYSFMHLSAGDLLRAEVKSGSERGKQLTEIMEKGELVPQDVVLQLLKESMEASLASSKVFLIDGYPRKLEQGIEFEKEITECQFLLYFEVSDEEMTTRLLKRGETSGRSDDNEETIKKRLSVFHEHTTPVLDHFKEKTKKVAAESGTPDDIFVEVVKLLEGHGIVAAAAEQSEKNATPSEEQKEGKPLETNDAKTEESQPEETEAKAEEKGNEETTEEAPAEPAPKTEDKPEEAASEDKVEEPASEEKAEESEQKEGVSEPVQASEEKPEQTSEEKPEHTSEENAVDKKEETETKEESPEETKTEDNTESAKDETTPEAEGNTGGEEEKVEEATTEETKAENVPETDNTDG
ncbi:adenylate kinase isoenzyme 5-like isoform X2 [Anneissia japonica]|uniref:adenylate kinase isoenzyme 5-like isoform X2 n=1 Tax=Anneissia japonica TaxID=1529436 RepID=UPI00142583E1|nr:adenylate kinase isoenzyme 5-like isoform X2 [Anneissia japonica]